MKKILSILFTLFITISLINFNEQNVKAAGYLVMFDLQGHGTNFPQLAVQGGLVSKPNPDPSTDGYIFGGWYKEAECTNPWDFDTDTYSPPTTIYAKWTAIPSTPVEVVEEDNTPPTTCEYVVGPRWHWNDDLGVCELEGYEVINTSTK